MIANGILLAFKELHISLPVVVRIRGTNEKEGQKIVVLPLLPIKCTALTIFYLQIAESGLPLFAFDDFEEAAIKAIELANS